MWQEKKSNKITSKVRTAKELADFYGVDVKTFNKWMNCDSLKHIKRAGNTYTIKQLREIIKHLDEPD